MRIRCSRQTNQGLTLVEAVVVVFVIAFLVMLLLPEAFYSPHRGGQRTSCVNNLKQLGLAVKVWSGDNNDRFPMEVSVTNGGVMEWMNTPDAWKTFQVISNEASTPKIYYCPEDFKCGRSATNFTDDLKARVSYFIGVNAKDTNPTMLLSGDDNFLLNESPVKPGTVSVTSPAQLAWDETRHGTVKQRWFRRDKKIGSGCLLFTDGSVQGVLDSGLTNCLGQTGLATNRLVIP
ncbi:MAG: hypothetical protein P4N60_22630 [Verrucomicrobiae bacterium]|nr:hypothetical protein [Verrucomicrobiae bacterium]